MNSFDPAADNWDPPVFDIFILGTRSSGKTVLLSSLYQKLSSMDGVTNFYARCDDPTQHRELCESYDTILDTRADWPTGTYQVESYDMQCFHRMRGQSLPMFNLRFHEYPGGYISSQTDEREFVEERAAACHSVIALIDGRKIFNRLEGLEDNPVYSLQKDLDSLVRVLQQCIGKPVHFVVTKSDLLDPAKYPLRRIVEELLKHGGFKDIVEQQRAEEASCYVIPVSAVGPKFTYIDPAENAIRKRPNGVIEPFNLDVMVSASVVDAILDTKKLVETAEQQPDPKNWAAETEKKHGKKLVYGRMMAPTLASLLLGPLGVISAVAASIASDRYISEKARSFQQQIGEIRAKIADRKSALEAIVHIQFLLLERFVRRFPEGSLGARFETALYGAEKNRAGGQQAPKKVAQPNKKRPTTDATATKKSEPGSQKVHVVSPPIDTVEKTKAEPETTGLADFVGQIIGVLIWGAIAWYAYQWWSSNQQDAQKSAAIAAKSIAAKEANPVQGYYERSCAAGDKEICAGMTGANANRWQAISKSFATISRAVNSACPSGPKNSSCREDADRLSAALQDPKRSSAVRSMYKTICDGGSASGCWTLAKIYDGGFFGSPDKLQATAYYYKACKAGLQEGCKEIQ